MHVIHPRFMIQEMSSMLILRMLIQQIYMDKNRYITPTIGCAGFTRTAGEVRMIPSSLALI
jgi:hypothetical protein